MPTAKDCANAIRFLAIDAVEQAKSGHPGMPMGMADIAQTLWREELKVNPKNPHWINRDRFVLSNGHGSMLIYALLHLTGYDLPIEELKNFRQLHSKTPGHPEVPETPGVETTTGPLGQGIANAVGMALAETHLAATFNKPELPIIDHYTYAFLGDGCLMEGISHEAASLAGTLQLGKLIAFWDNNQISIDGNVQGWFTDDTAKRFEAYGWQVIRGVDGHDSASILAAIKEAKADSTRPTLIDCKTTIGYGSPKLAGTAKTHGAPLGADEIAATRAALNWPHAPFEIPHDIKQAWDQSERGAALEAKWDTLFADYQAQYPTEASELLRRLQSELPSDWANQIDALITKTCDEKSDLATRQSSQQCLNTLAINLPELVGGSADLTGSNGTKWTEATVFTHDNPQGRYINYGVREFGMSAIMNGMSLYGGIRPFAGTFLTFVDYARNAVRMAALMEQPTVFVYTHDSIGLGEDGPTHQPIEHLAMLRNTPNVHSWRPADTTEVAYAWKAAIEKQDGPTCLILSRQKLPYLQETQTDTANIDKGGYILWESNQGEIPELLFIGTGSEVQLAREAAQVVHEKTGKATRVISMPCPELFLTQPHAYQEQVLPAECDKRLAIEAASTNYWYQFVGLKGKVIGIDRFGLSAPASECYKELHITCDHLVESAIELI